MHLHHDFCIIYVVGCAVSGCECEFDVGDDDDVPHNANAGREVERAVLLGNAILEHFCALQQSGGLMDFGSLL